MRIENLERAVLIKRYKRFLADVQLQNGEIIVAHCPNPGSMIGCQEPGSPVLIQKSSDPKRKLPYTLSVVWSGDVAINVNTMLANKVVAEALGRKEISWFEGYASVRPEVGFRDSRFDFFLSEHSKSKNDCFVEVKSTTLADTDQGLAMFPDAPTERGRKHLNALMHAVSDGYRAVQFYLIARADCQKFSPADHIDKAYGETLRQAHKAGVEIMAFDIDIRVDDPEAKPQSGFTTKSLSSKKTITPPAIAADLVLRKVVKLEI